MDVVILGQGYVGLPLSIIIAKSGYKVFGVDIDKNRIQKLKLGEIEIENRIDHELLGLQSDGKIIFSTEVPNINEKAIYIITVPTPLKIDRTPDLVFLENACQMVARKIKSESLIICESTSYIGSLRNFIKPIFDRTVPKSNIYYAVAPERIDPGNKFWKISNTPRVVSGLTMESKELVTDFYNNFCDNVIVVSCPEVAEASKLYENTFRHVNIALVNELANIMNKLGISMHEVISAASSKPYGFMAFNPGLGVGGHCIPIDPSYLRFSSNLINESVRLVEISDDINESLPRQIALRIQVELDGVLENKLIQIAGISYKPNTPDIRESPALKLIEELQLCGAKVIWHDPVVKFFGEQESKPLATNIDLGIIVSPHDAIDFSIWKKSNTRVIDLSADSKNYGWSKFV